MIHPEGRGRFWTDDVCTEDLSILVLGRSFNVWICKQVDDEDLDSVTAQYCQKLSILCDPIAGTLWRSVKDLVFGCGQFKG